MPKITLNFEDGVIRIIDSNPGESVAEAAYRERINIPLDCADGACGTCKCFCKSGDYDPGDYIEDALSDEEAKQGFGLACQMRPTTDLDIDILASSAACKVQVATFAAIISKIELASPEIIKLVLMPTDGSFIDFLPGQYVNIELPETAETRSYSFANKPGSEALEFLIRLVPGGLMSTYLKEKAKIGDSLNLTGPLGSFYNREIVRPTLFYAGGTGIAPFISMLEKISDLKSAQSIQLFYGATTEENLIELDRLKAFTQKNSLQIYTCVSASEATNHAFGYVTQWVNKQDLLHNDYDIYICGPNAMVDSVKSSLAEQGIAYTNFYTEKFLPTGINSM